MFILFTFVVCKFVVIRYVVWVFVGFVSLFVVFVLSCFEWFGCYYRVVDFVIGCLILLVGCFAAVCLLFTSCRFCLIWLSFVFDICCCIACVGYLFGGLDVPFWFVCYGCCIVFGVWIWVVVVIECSFFGLLYWLVVL